MFWQDMMAIDRRKPKDLVASERAGTRNGGGSGGGGEGGRRRFWMPNWLLVRLLPTQCTENIFV